MNRQIKELAEQANIKHDEHNDVYYNDSYDGIRRVWLEKFAELIVRECAGIYSKIDNGNLHMGTDDYLTALVKHFEVNK
jgi:hypothetical protein